MAMLNNQMVYPFYLDKLVGFETSTPQQHHSSLPRATHVKLMGTRRASSAKLHGILVGYGSRGRYVFLVARIGINGSHISIDK